MTLTLNQPLLIIGGSGFLGSELVRQASAAGHRALATYATQPNSKATAIAWLHLDLRDPSSIHTVLTQVKPGTIINASSGRADWAITAEGPVHLAMAAAHHGARLVHVSSDAVFSGTSRTYYDESCRPDPVTPYGAAKAAAETGTLAVHPQAAVARTSLIFGPGAEHERLVHHLANGARDGALYVDDVRCPVHVSDLAAALLEIAAGGAAGILHLAGPDALTRHELGVLIARRDGLDPARLLTARRADSPHPGALDVRLDSRATQQQLRTTLRGATEFLKP
ncbi:SDR family oxidoreductase [Streptomyces sp. NPDC087440]|uniref:SDR family oxidoreductase n=1 Tax=Streptomyces sp. NPDC087440 TaxID=3365790 RepID=UPI0037F2BD14